MDHIVQLATTLGLRLQDRGLMIACAESCTGGGLAYAITEIAGSSAWFDRGFVTYSNAAKVDMLGVDATLIDAHGAVSEQVAAAMALGAVKNSLAQVGVSTTGIAGPGGATPGKPVGTVCFGFCVDGNIRTERIVFDGDRHAVREQSIAHALLKMTELLGPA